MHFLVVLLQFVVLLMPVVVVVTKSSFSTVCHKYHVSIDFFLTVELSVTDQQSWRARGEGATEGFWKTFFWSIFFVVLSAELDNGLKIRRIQRRLIEPNLNSF